MRRTLCAVSFLVATSSLAAGHDLAPLAFGPTAYQVTNPVVATNGQTFLSLWTMSTYLSGDYIYGSIADAQGFRDGANADAASGPNECHGDG